MKSFFKILLLILLTSCGSITSSNLNTSSFSTSSSFNSGSTTASKVSSFVVSQKDAVPDYKFSDFC
jgi:hypothetical protein